MKSRALILISLFFLSSPVFAQSDTVRTYIDSALSVLKENSLYAKSVKWKRIETEIYTKAKNAQSRNEAFELLKIAFNALGDKHANYYSPEGVSFRLDNAELFGRYSDSLKAGWKRGLRIDNKMIGDIAYISIPTLGVGKQQDIDKYANMIYDAVNNLSKKKPEGWIIDLRMNGGGNIRPMLGGLAMFFDEGVYTYYVDRDGKASDEAGFKNGDFVIDNKVQAEIWTKMGSPLSTSKVAVLLGPGTASSGEGVALVFSQRKNVRYFGTNTAGLANSTNGFVFYDNEYYFLISVARIANSKKKIYAEIVKPDVYVNEPENFFNVSDDPAVKEAIKWLHL
jgi:carboxyl-terminal processing protease